MCLQVCVCPRSARRDSALYCTVLILYCTGKKTPVPVCTRSLHSAHPWHEDAGDNMKMDLALGETMSIIKKHEKQYGETLDMTVRRRRGGKKAKNRMNQVIVLTLHSQGTTSGRISLPR